MATYDAFISYSHAKDKPIAAALQSVVQKLGKPWYKRRALRIFRDDTSLSATPHLWPTIEQALAQSRFFILLASPEAAFSKWVNKEVVYWLEHKSIDTLLIALIDGELSWNSAAGDFATSADTPLPPELKGRFQTEPKWVDLHRYRDSATMRDTKFMDLAANFAAAVRGIPKEDLLSQEVRQQRRALTLAWTAAGSLLILVGAAVWQWNIAIHQRKEAQAQRDRADRNFVTAESNFGVARETTNNMIAGTAQGLRNLKKIDVTTIEIVLKAIDAAIDKLKKAYPDNPLIDLSQAAVRFEFAKTFQAEGDLPHAFNEAGESFQIRSRITKYDHMASFPEQFEAIPGEWRWELSNSLELLGDLHREQSKDQKLEELTKRLYHDEARSRFLEALAIRQRLIETLIEKDKKDDWALGISLSFTRLGDLSVEDNDLIAAQGYYEQSLKNAAGFFNRNKASPLWQRELSWNFNKVGDTKLRNGEHNAKSGAPNSDVAEALGDFKNSLCIRRSLVTKENMLLKRDVSYTLIRIGDANLLLKNRSGAETAYFESFLIRLELLDNDPKDKRYVDDVAAVSQKIGNLYREEDLEKALAYFEYASDIRSKFLLQASDKEKGQIDLEAANKAVQGIRSQLDQNRLKGRHGPWWRARVEDELDRATKFQDALDRGATDCWNVVAASVDQIVGLIPKGTMQ